MAEDKRVPHMLTMMVDLSHPTLAAGTAESRVQLIGVLSAFAEAALRGSEASIARDPKGVNVGLFIITEDSDRSGKDAFDKACVALEYADAQGAAKHALNG